MARIRECQEPLWGLPSTGVRKRPWDLGLNLMEPLEVCVERGQGRNRNQFTAAFPRGLGDRQVEGGFAWTPGQIQAPLSCVLCPAQPHSSLHCHVCVPDSCDSRYRTYVQVLPLMVSLEVENRRPHCSEEEPGESLRGMGSV